MAGSALAKTGSAGPGDLRPVTDAGGAGGGGNGLPLAQGSQVGSGVSCGQPPGSEVGSGLFLPHGVSPNHKTQLPPLTQSISCGDGDRLAGASLREVPQPSLSPQAQKAVALSSQKLTS